MKAIPGGTEPDFVLVSCTGEAVDADVRPGVIQTKKAAEASLRASGLGYTIVRPGPLVQEAGGQKALVFQQSEETGQNVAGSISYADVADVCIRTLHDQEAYNKTFEVSAESLNQANDEMYELIGVLPDRTISSSKSLAPALARLEKNT